MLFDKKSGSGQNCPSSEDIEIILKQLQANLLKSWGYDIKLSFKDIENPKSFVGSPGNVFNGGYLRPANIKKLKDDSSIQIPTPSEKTRKILAPVFELLRQTTNVSPNDKPIHHKREKHHGEVHHSLEHFDLHSLHTGYIGAIRNDTIDTNLLRYVRARKFKEKAALEMATKCVDWRVNLHKVDQWLFAGDAEPYLAGTHPKMIEAFKLNQAYLRGKDLDGRPIIVIHVHKHFRGNCPDRDFETLICLIIEWTRLCLKDFQEGVDKGSILFDMTGFSLKNADLAAVRFLATQFEANYPECLGAIWIHKAPWVFNTVWKIIKGWLDPVVASKIHFTNTLEDLEKFVPTKYIPKLLGGKDAYEMEYVAPTHENSDTIPKDAKYESLVREREEASASLLETTLKWIGTKDPAVSAVYLKHRINLQLALAKNYIELDPYIRRRGVFDRNGELGEMGY